MKPLENLEGKVLVLVFTNKKKHKLWKQKKNEQVGLSKVANLLH